MIEVLINGRDVQMIGGLTFSDTVEELIPSCNFTLVDYSVNPRFNEKVEIYDNGVLMFTGVITALSERSILKNTRISITAMQIKWLLNKIPTQYVTEPSITANQAIIDLMTKSGSEGTGCSTFDIHVGDIDDLTQFNTFFTTSMAFGSDSLRQSLDRLAELFLAVWWIDNDRLLNFKLIDNLPVNVIDGVKQFELSDKVYSEDNSQYRNTEVLYSPQVETTNYIVEIKSGQNDDREYLLPYGVARDISVSRSFDGGLTYEPLTVAQKPQSGDTTEMEEMWLWEFGSPVITLNHAYPTQPETTLFKFEYIGLTTWKSRVASEQLIKHDSQKIGVPRAVLEYFEQDDRPNTQKELYTHNISKLIRYGLPQVTLSLTFKIDPLWNVGEKYTFDEFGYDAMIATSKQVSIGNEYGGRKVQTEYTYEFKPTITKPLLYELARMIKETDYEQNLEINEINIYVGVAQLSWEIDSFMIIEADEDLWTNDNLYTSADLYAGGNEIC